MHFPFGSACPSSCPYPALYPSPSVEVSCHTSACRQEHQQGALTDYDFAGIFLLAYMALRRPKSWAGGLRRVSTEAGSIEIGASRPLGSVPGLVDRLGEEYLRRKLRCDPTELTVMDLFARLQFVGIKKSSKKKNTDNYVNATMVNWSLGCRPYRLLHHIPTPMEVPLVPSGQKDVRGHGCGVGAFVGVPHPQGRISSPPPPPPHTPATLTCNIHGPPLPALRHPQFRGSTGNSRCCSAES